jgi:hypothetical protein
MTMPANTFTKRWVITFAALALLIAMFPIILPWLVRSTGCARVGGACGAVAMVLGIYIRLPIVLGVGIYLTWLAARRASAVGLQFWAPLFVFLMFVGSSPLLFALGNFWASAFALGIIVAPSLAILGFLLAALVGLSLLPDDTAQLPGRERTATLITGGLSLFLTGPQWLQPFAMLVGFRPIYSVIGVIYAPLAPLHRLTGGHLTLILLAAFVTAFALWIASARRQCQ